MPGNLKGPTSTTEWKCLLETGRNRCKLYVGPVSYDSALYRDLACRWRLNSPLCTLHPLWTFTMSHTWCTHACTVMDCSFAFCWENEILVFCISIFPLYILWSEEGGGHSKLINFVPLGYDCDSNTLAVCQNKKWKQEHHLLNTLPQSGFSTTWLKYCLVLLLLFFFSVCLKPITVCNICPKIVQISLPQMSQI